MSGLARYVANCLWLSTCAGEHTRFRSALDDVAATQRRVLEEILARDGRCAYARAHGFAGARTVGDFRRRAPIADYEDHAPYVARSLHGAVGQLTAQPISTFQPSSGTTSATKLVPYTAAVQRAFTRAIGPWVFALYSRRPAIARGSVYWSISPPASATAGAADLVGFADDSEYLGSVGRTAYRYASATPPSLARQRSPERFKTELWRGLLAAEDLAFVSIWSPTYLLSLLGWLTEHAAPVLELLGPVAARERVVTLRRLLAAGDLAALARYAWPDLVQISCWTHGTSAPYAAELREAFPGVELEGKGLVATEAIVSIPFAAGADPVLAARSHFFEFVAPNGAVLLAHEVAVGETYSVLVTTGGGLYRYRLHDLVEVTGRLGAAPTLRFVSKDDLVSDQTGEKLNAVHVARAVGPLSQELGLVGFRLLAPRRAGGAAGYALYVEEQAGLAARAVELARRLDATLRENFHYDHSRSLGQLEPVTVLAIPRGVPALAIYTAEICRRTGSRAGDVKPQILDDRAVWDSLLGPREPRGSAR